MTTLLDALSDLYNTNNSKLVQDYHRVPVPLVDNAFGYRIGLLPIVNEFHCLCVLLIWAQIVVCLGFGLTIWYGILIPTRQSKDGNVPLPSLLLGFGVVIPAALIGPLYFFDAMDFRSMPIRFLCIFVPMMVPLRCLDAMSGVDSAHRRLRTASLRHYAYYSLPMKPKSRKTTTTEAIMKRQR